MNFIIKRIPLEERSLEEILFEVELLELDYGLSRWFYTDREWMKYTITRMKLISIINKLSMYDVQYV